jgi:hypothetical protein
MVNQSVQGYIQLLGAFSNFTNSAANLSKENNDLYKALAYSSIVLSEAQALASGIAAVSNSPDAHWSVKIAGYVSILASVLGAFSQVYSVYNQSDSYAEGVIDIKRGKHKAGKDTIPAWIDEGETITTAEKTKKYKDVLTAIHKDSFEKYIYDHYQLPLITELANAEFDRSKKGDNIIIKSDFTDYNILRKFNDQMYLMKIHNDKLIRTLTKRQKIR